MRRILVFGAVLFLLHSSFAQTNEPLQELEEVVVRGQTISGDLVTIHVISAEDLEATSPQVLTSALEGIPGVQVVRQGSLGSVSSLFLRGTNSQHVALFINGVRQKSATVGSPGIDNLAVSDIERIEVLMGPFSSVAGSDAVGGVVQIFTKAGAGCKGFCGQASTAHGNFGTHDYKLSGGYRAEQGGIQLNLGRFKTAGADAQRPLPELWGSEEPQNADKDGYKIDSVSLRGDRSIGKKLKVDGGIAHTRGESEYDGSAFYGDVIGFETLSADVGVTYQVTPAALVLLRGTYGTDDQNYFRRDDSVPEDTINTERFGLRLMGVYEFSLAGVSQKITLGGDFENESIAGTTVYDKDGRKTVAGFAEYEGRKGNWSYRAGARNDNHEAYGSSQTWSAGVARNIPEVHRDLSIRANAGTAFREPSFNELYYPGYGNPNLNPEESNSYELVVEMNRPGVYRVSISRFHTDIDDLIQFDPNTFTAQNIAVAEIDGYELNSQMRMGRVQTNAHVTYTDPRDKNTGKVLPRRARVQAGASVQTSEPVLGVTPRVGVRYVGKSYDDTANTRTLRSHVLVDASVRKNIGRTEVSLNGENLTNKRYERAYGYPNPGRQVVARFTVRLPQN